jgi:sulfatase maturation enzyme AslB (radical SAM superfamily)
MLPPASTDLRAVKLVLTAGCNLRCSYCYQSEKSNRRMEWDVVRAALDRLLASKHPYVKVLFIGGEPLLEFPTIERATAYLAEHKRPDMTIRHSIITNGLLLGQREIQFLVEHRFRTQLSFDGVPTAQRLRGERTFAVLDTLMDSLRREHPAFYDHLFRVNITLVPATLPWLADSVDYFVQGKRIQDLSITPQFTATPAWERDRIHELDRVFARIFRVCLQRYRETGDVPLEVFRKDGPSPTAAPAGRSMCGVGRGDQLAVDVDGQAHGCLTFVGSYQTFPTAFLRSRLEAMRLGDVRSVALQDRLAVYPEAVRAAEIFHHKEEKYSSYQRCGECRYLADCVVCPMSIGREEGQNDPRRVPDFNCAYNLISLKYRARFPRQRSLAERLRGPSWTGIAIGRRVPLASDLRKS